MKFTVFANGRSEVIEATNRFAAAEKWAERCEIRQATEVQVTADGQSSTLVVEPRKTVTYVARES